MSLLIRLRALFGLDGHGLASRTWPRLSRVVIAATAAA